MPSFSRIAVGWRDFDPSITQKDIREAIRIAIRRSVQIAVQFIAPAVLVALLVRELGGWLCAPQRA